MSLVASRVVEDLSVAPDRRFRSLVDVLSGLAEADEDIGQLEVVVQVGGEEALRARVGPEQPTDAPLMAICGSAFKPALALCLLQVLHRAHIDPDEPLAAHGVDLVDGRTTGRHLVDHQAGLPHIRAVAAEVGSLGDGPAITAALRRTPPLWSPGARSAYHAISYGYLVGAVCEDLAEGAESMTDLLWDLVLTPAGIGSDEIALPGDDGAAPAVDLFVTGTSPLPWRPQGRSLIYRALYSLPDLVGHLNSPVGRSCPPLSCGVPCTAAALAGLYGALIAPSPARPGFPEDVRAFVAADRKPAFDHVMRQRLTWSGGTLVGAGIRRLVERPGLVGLPGYGGSMGLGDPASGVSLGIISTRLEADRIVGRDAESICHALFDALDE